MVNMPENVIEHIKANKTVVLATVSEDGIPNAVPNMFVEVKSPDTILIGDNFFKKTAANLKKPNSQIAICSWVSTKEGYQIKGVANYVTSGPNYEAMKQIIKSRSDKLPAKGCVIMNVTEVYDLAAGPNAGNKIV
jgi:predicted pyridoxine 5'-phosphate oxidase superfamily flavin-nucleotide-binding protein